MLPPTVQWYELVWIALMFAATCANIFALTQSIADRAAARRAAQRAGVPWDRHSNPNRIVSAQQIRNTLLPLAIVLPGLGVGVSAALALPMPPPPGTQIILGIPRTGFLLTIFFLFMAAVLAAKPLMNLYDARLLYAMAGLFMVHADRRTRAERVNDTLRWLLVILVMATVIYAYSLWQDLSVTAQLDGGVELTPERFGTQFFRSTLSQIVTGTWGALLFGGVIGAFYRLRGPLDRDEMAREIEREARGRDGDQGD